MIGVALCVNGTFGTANGVERIAVSRAAAQLTRLHGCDAASAPFERLARAPDAAFASPGSACDLLSAALGPALSARVGRGALEGLIRSESVRVVDERLVPDAELSAVLRTLAELNVPRAALSLGWPGIDRGKADAAGFDGEFVVAGDIATANGGLAPFIRLAQTLRLPADRIFLVGSDARSELHPAAVAGMRTVRLDPDGAPYPDDLQPPEFTIASIEGLLPILSGPYTQGLLALRQIMRTALGWREGHFVPTDADVVSPPLSGDDDRP